MSYLIAIHLLSAIVWVGGMFFALMVLRPATGPLERARAGISGLGLTTEQQKNFADTVDEAIGRIEAAERRGTSWR